MNEHLIISQLDPDTPVTPDDLRFILHLCIMDCFDRRVTREFFHDILNAYQKQLGLLKQIEIVAIAERENGEPSGLLPAMTSQLKRLREDTYAKMQLVIQCPMDEDPIS